MENPINFYKEVIKWVKSYVEHNPNKYTTINIGFDYMNTPSSKIIYEIIKELSMMNKKYRKFIIKYEEDDEDMLMVYENFEYLLEVEFEYNMIMF
jgi:SiaC family regulatory phosphoprotein